MKKISALAIAGVFTASLAATAFAEMAEVKVGGEIRVRDEVRNNYSDFDKDTNDSTSVISQRTRVNVDAKVNETTKAYISLQDTRNWGSEANTATTGNEGSQNATTKNVTFGQAVDVSQAYLQLDQIAGQPLSLKIGRQQLAYGEHRLIGNFEWSDNARRFDAIKLMYNSDAFGVDLFTAKVSETASIGTSATQKFDSNDGDTTFNGIYATVKTIPTSTLDLYLLQKVADNSDKLDILTYGLRLNGGAMNIDWTAEAAWQSGNAAKDVDQKANMYALRAGYTLPEVASLRIGGEYVYSSGDDGTDATEVNTFDNLYPTNHPLYGVSDVLEYYTAGNALSGVDGTGLTAWSLNVSAKPVKGLKLLAEYWNYQSSEDYAAGKDQIGTEANIQAWYAINPNVDLHAYYAQFTPDSDLTSPGPDDAATDAVVQVVVKF